MVEFVDCGVVDEHPGPSSHHDIYMYPVEIPTKCLETRLGGVAHNGFSMAMILVSTNHDM